MTVRNLIHQLLDLPLEAEVKVQRQTGLATLDDVEDRSDEQVASRS